MERRHWRFLGDEENVSALEWPSKRSKVPTVLTWGRRLVIQKSVVHI
jgi:hypothetical protein